MKNFLALLYRLIYIIYVEINNIENKESRFTVYQILINLSFPQNIFLTICYDLFVKDNLSIYVYKIMETISEAKQDFQSVIKTMRETLGDQEKVQGKLSREEKVSVLRSCSILQYV